MIIKVHYPALPAKCVLGCILSYLYKYYHDISADDTVDTLIQSGIDDDFQLALKSVQTRNSEQPYMSLDDNPFDTLFLMSNAIEPYSIFKRIIDNLGVSVHLEIDANLFPDKSKYLEQLNIINKLVDYSIIQELVFK